MSWFVAVGGGGGNGDGGVGIRVCYFCLNVCLCTPNVAR